MSGSTLSRRTALKTIGATTGAALGVGSAAAGGQLDITIWPHTSNDTTAANNAIFDRLAHFLDQLYSNGAIGDYSLQAEDTTLEQKIDDLATIDSNCDTGSWFYDFEQNVTRGDGCHIAVTGQTNFASARGECWGGNGPGHAYVGTKGGYDYTSEDTERYQNLAIQEVGHVIINESHIQDSSSLDHPEHALGRLKVTDWDNYTGPSTPMVTYYEENTDGDGTDYNPCADLGEEGTNGECANGDWVSWDGTHQRDVTQCTIDAVKATYQNDGY